ncbi:MAG: molybdenum cofactor guanylyltransferase [Spirochaetaceae bacterium]|jgi:molybdopterin-guanine dinucleotide biosynthesis protein A|nr:molybdenum cofactor guanylyltransferase [Spirochaetaceae bacterium]
MTGKDGSQNICQSALILGGGTGSRLGYDKKTLTLHGVSVLDGLITTLAGIFPHVLLSCRADSVAPDRRVTVVPDILGAGSLAGIYAGLCAGTGDYLFVCACDMPFVNADFIRYAAALIKADAEDAARAAPKDIYIYRAAPKPGQKNAGYEPFNAFYRTTLAHSARAALEKGAYKLTPFIESASLRLFDAEEIARFGGETMFWNINNAEDLRRAEALRP